MGIIEKRKAFEAMRERLGMILKQAGPEGDMSKVTLLEGDKVTKLSQITRMNKELEEMDTEVKELAALEEIQKKNIERFEVKVPAQNMPVHPGAATQKAADPYTGDIKSFGHFIQMLVDEPGKLKAMGLESGEGGGFAVPDQFATRILSVPAMASIVRPRATVLPPGEYPDAKMEIPALRQGASGLYGGVTFAAASEGTAGTTNDPKLDNVILEPQRMSGHVIIGNSLLRNATAMSAFIENLFRNGKAGFEDQQFIQGVGGPFPLGFLNCPGKVNVVRTTAATIVFTDIANMLAKMYGDNPIWIASKSAIPKLVAMADTAGNSIYIVGDITKSLPPTLAGYPLYLTFRNPVLGSEGDLMLVDPSYYLIKDGSGPFVQASEHVLFKEDQTIVKMTWWIDGEPWVKTPILMEDSTTSVSPYVVLR